MKTLLALIIFAIPVDLNDLLDPRADVITDAVSLHGCYKRTGERLCLEVTRIRCFRDRSETVRLYGSVIANLCKELRRAKRRAKQ